jgi:hypothetical protein
MFREHHSYHSLISVASSLETVVQDPSIDYYRQVRSEDTVAVCIELHPPENFDTTKQIMMLHAILPTILVYSVKALVNCFLLVINGAAIVAVYQESKIYNLYTIPVGYWMSQSLYL